MTPELEGRLLDLHQMKECLKDLRRYTNPHTLPASTMALLRAVDMLMAREISTAEQEISALGITDV